MKQTDSGLSMMILALLLLVVAGIGFFEFVEPSYSAVMALKGQVAGEEAFLATQQQLAQQAQAALTQFQSQSSTAEAVNLAMPVGADSAGALAQIYGLAGESGVSIQSAGISLAAVQTADSTDATGTAALIEPDGTINFQIDAVGTYEALTTFLKGLETNVRIFDVTGLSLKPVATVTPNGAAITGTQDLYNFTIGITAYYQSP